MLNFIMIVAAIIVANIVMLGLGVLMLNMKSVMRWYYRWYMKIINVMTEEVMKEEESKNE